jgi:hypothetical protein
VYRVSRNSEDYFPYCFKRSITLEGELPSLRSFENIASEHTTRRYQCRFRNSRNSDHAWTELTRGEHSSDCRDRMQGDWSRDDHRGEWSKHIFRIRWILILWSRRGAVI